MNSFFKAVSLCLICVVLWLTLSNFNKTFALLLSAAACCMVMGLAYTYLEPVLAFFRDLQNRALWNSDAAQIVIRATGIGVISELTAMLCTDSGNAALGKAVRTVAASAVMWLSLPMFRVLLELIDTVVASL